MYTVVLKPRPEKQLRKLQKKDQERIRQALDSIAANPFEGKKLEGQLRNHYSVRVWPYRIVYSIEKRIVTVTVVNIAHRKDVYLSVR